MDNMNLTISSEDLHNLFFIRQQSNQSVNTVEKTGQPINQPTYKHLSK